MPSDFDVNVQIKIILPGHSPDNMFDLSRPVEDLNQRVITGTCINQNSGLHILQC
ncbi:MAG: hypothetical protein WKG06_23185 [Segetibacter sp.]